MTRIERMYADQTMNEGMGAMQHELLARLIDAISDLVRHHDLHRSAKGDAVNALARAHLFTMLRQLDGRHKGLALQFLYEANLLGSHVVAAQPPTRPVLALNGADLAGVSLPHAYLAWGHFVAADIARADLRGASLVHAHLGAVDLIDADLTQADLRGANLVMADITGANLDGADLRAALVLPAQLAVARVTHATRLPESE
jgi:uncharacterized protein YjbI with pentapeptide repeats